MEMCFGWLLFVALSKLLVSPGGSYIKPSDSKFFVNLYPNNSVCVYRKLLSFVK